MESQGPVPRMEYLKLMMWSILYAEIYAGFAVTLYWVTHWLWLPLALIPFACAMWIATVKFQADIKYSRRAK